MFNTKFNIWEHSAIIDELYKKRALDEEEEMNCAKQTVEILEPYIKDGDTILDAGCGSGYYFHSLKKTNKEFDYYGVDHSPSLIEMGRQCLSKFGLHPSHLWCDEIENLDMEFDIIMCINTLYACQNYHLPLERIANCTKKVFLLRSNFRENTEYRYLPDTYLREGYKHLRAYWNIYGRDEIRKFVEDLGFEVEFITDRHTGGEMQMVVDIPHYWEFMLAKRA